MRWFEQTAWFFWVWIASRALARWIIGAHGLWQPDSNTLSELGKASGDEGARWNEETRWNKGVRVPSSHLIPLPVQLWIPNINGRVIGYLVFLNFFKFFILFCPSGEEAICFQLQCTRVTFRHSTVNKPFLKEQLITGLFHYAIYWFMV